MAKKKEIDNGTVTKKDIKKATAGLLRRIILGFAIIGIIFSGFIIINQYIVPKIQQKKYKNDSSYSVDESNTNLVTAENSDEKIKEKYLSLLNINPDFVGKLYIDAIEDAGYNVVQCDNNKKYLTKGFKGESTRYGTLFVDYRNDVKSFDTNTIIYGHNMRDGSQLGSLSLYSKLKNYKKYPTVRFNTIYNENEWKIFAAFVINTEAKDDNGYVFPYLTTEFKSDALFMSFIDDVKSRSFFINDSVDILPEDKILTLSTCDTSFSDARFVVMARLVRDGESATVDVEKAKKNENQRFPQAWYDKYGKSNPYKDADKYENELSGKYSALLSMNPDFVGKLYVDALDDVGYNVVQGTDNKKYLNTGFKGESTKFGTLFADCKNDLNRLNTNTVIYGDNMRNGSPLGSFTDYRSIELYKKYPTIRFNTLYGDSEWKIFAAFDINSDPDDDNDYAFPYKTTDFPSDEKFMEFVSDVKSRSYYVNDSVDIKPGDKILTVSVYSSAFYNARFVVMARLVRRGESPEVNTAAARENQNQRFPQAWYDDRGRRNPFRNAEKFTLN